MQRHLKKTGRWATWRRININANETKAVVFSKRTRLKLPELRLHGALTEIFPNCRYLGVILNHRMNWSKHCEWLRGPLCHGNHYWACYFLQGSTSPRRHGDIAKDITTATPCNHGLPNHVTKNAARNLQSLLLHKQKWTWKKSHCYIIFIYVAKILSRRRKRRRKKYRYILLY
jgi:hypothetical protein